MDDEAPKICGIHHVKFPVADVAASRDWYCRVLGFRKEFEWVEDGRLMGVALVHPASSVRLGLRQAPERVRSLSDFDPVAWAVDTKQELETWAVDTKQELETWAAHLNHQGVEHGPMVSATIGWMIAFKDPDGLEVKPYTLERP
jgi:catechol 2,3-dioxygenase-like lactoylglutathione lyase family enzyme